MSLLVTGSAGFIGFHVAKAVLLRGEKVVGIDNLNDYYDVSLKQARLKELELFDNFTFYLADITDKATMTRVFQKHQPTRVIHLAAQAGVRYSLENPHVYVQSNVLGFTTLIELARQFEVSHWVYASTSSVYGANEAQPYSESQGTNHPLTVYAATKKANELLAHVYAHLYQLPCTGLRFFTVYGPYGRPDMAFFKFTRCILEEKPIQIYNHGNMARDFTYIDDIVKGILHATDTPASPNPHWSSMTPDPASSYAPYRIYNIGCGRRVKLMDYIEAIEKATGKRAIKEFLPFQEGDVLSTHADTARLKADFDYTPEINIEEGVNRFVKWYQAFYHNENLVLS